MVMTSQQIAAQVGAFQQQSMMSMQHSGMLSQFAGAGNPQMAAGSMVGSAMNTAGAVGQPLMQGGMMLAGIDPMTAGMRAAWAARGGGMLAAGGAGLTAGAAVGVPLMAAQYAGTQMFQGARQQQRLAGQLGTFQFANQYGGRGFTSGEVGGIGQTFRQMAGHRGPGGEFVTMDELGRLAANMGRMGMAQGVRNAKDFREKFQQMMRTVKEVATQLSTSLEEAQKTMAAMKGSGIFGGRNQAAAAAAIRQGVVAGGRTTAEMSQIANIGAQMARAVGGRGRAGAMAGMEALTRVGTAVRAGVLTEEDIYNQTGQTGAAGQQAMAASMVQGDVQFFKSNLGRRVLAAMAGRGGRLDPESMRRMMSGEVGTAETMQMAHRNLARVGRADFIRNEGRLRGEAAAAFGGMGRAMVARGWLKSRGMDLDKMDDRQMLFFQRKFGLDRDEADNVIRMARDLPRLMEAREQSMEEDKFIRGVEMSNRYRGLEGVKRRLEDARKKINSSLQQAGADIYTSGQNMVEGFINKVTGNMVETVDRDLTATIHSVMRGGPMGRALAATRLGLNLPGERGLGLVGTPTVGGARAAIFGGGAGDISDARFLQLNRRNFAAAGYNLATNTDIQRERERMGTGVARLGAAGRTTATLEDRLNRIQRIAGAVTETDEAAMQLGAQMKEQVIFESTQAGFGGRGGEALGNFGRQLERMAARDPSARRLHQRWKTASDEERSRIMGSVRAGAGIDRGGFQMAMPGVVGGFSAGQFATIADRHRAIGEYALGGLGGAGARRGRNISRVGGALGGALGGAAAGSFLGPVGTVAGGIAGGVAGYFGAGAAFDYFTGTKTPDVDPTAYGRILDSEEGRRLAESVLSQDELVRGTAMASIADRQAQIMAGVPQGEEMTRDQKAEMELLKDLAVTAEVNALDQKYNGRIPEEEWKRLERTRGMPREALRTRIGAVAATGSQKQREAMKQYARRAGETGRERMARHRARGIVKGGRITKRAMEGLGGVGAGRVTDEVLAQMGITPDTTPADDIEAMKKMSIGEMAIQSLISADQRRAQMRETDLMGARKLETLAQRDIADFERLYAQLGTDERETFIKQLRDKGFEQRAADLEGRAGIQKRLTKGFRKESVKGKQIGRLERESYYESVAREVGIEGLEFEKGATAAERKEALKKRIIGGDAMRKILGERGIGGAELDALARNIDKLEEARSKGDTDMAARLTKDIKEQSKRIESEKQKAQQDAQAQESDPSFRALTSVEKNTAGMLKILGSINSNTAQALKDLEGEKPGS